SFGQSGTPDELMKEYGLDATNIVAAVERVMKRK
ncbi:MAG: transketolase family protein, partial [Bacteroidia bacterium]